MWPRPHLLFSRALRSNNSGRVRNFRCGRGHIYFSAAGDLNVSADAFTFFLTLRRLCLSFKVAAATLKFSGVSVRTLPESRKGPSSRTSAIARHLFSLDRTPRAPILSSSRNSFAARHSRFRRFAQSDLH